ncbi:M23 family metallopeptidase [Desulfosporosinus sp. Sb-LF]|uniref:M23 family metallopeptidase n=1 Tax=Desulfosporosinus sp. Sb-LF TaxID=2560027 RepID=UPI00107FC94F|nr:M23 family metallopeptidase [Desulfosporosinus sp. Sb-LF]TGE33955.1 M23 family metallopeptidase [Desulfosporosinus sp. Sb-LF]
MDLLEDEGRRRVKVITGGVAFLMSLSLFLFPVSSVYSQVASRTVVCYSVVTVESGADLKALAERYHTTVPEIQKQNLAPNRRPGGTMTIQENVVEGKGISRGSKTSWNWPIIGVKSSDYGWRNGKFHHGLDIAIPSGSIVRAARAGKVVKTGWLGVYGLMVLVEHGDGVQTLYAHNSKISVKIGDQVVAGDEISISGNTGNSTGPHLHFEIRLNGKTVDPEGYLPKIGMGSITTINKLNVRM